MKTQRLRSKLLPLLLVLTLAAAHSATRALPNPVPLVNNPLVPDAIAPGSQGFTLTVNGTGFVSGSTVNWNGTPLATTFVSALQVTAVVPAGNVATPGTASVTVVNPGPGGGGSNAMLFSVRRSFIASSFAQDSFSVGSEPACLIAADLNADGKPDLATAMFQDTAVAVSIGKGDGTFAPPVFYPVAGQALAVVAADFNGDGKLDLAVSTWRGYTSVLLGNGDGTFQPRRDLNLGSDIEEDLTVGDFSQDGNLDLAVVLDSGVAIVLGNGDGTFLPPVEYVIGAGRAFGIAAGDFNRDGSLDLAISVENDNAVAILIGNGDGTFQNPIEYATGFAPYSLAASDFDENGIIDLVVQSELADSISILIGKGDGTFLNHVDYETQPALIGVATADLNADGHSDLVVPNQRSGTVSVFFGKGDGTFRGRSDFAAGQNPLGIAVADFNADGLLDLATATQGNDSVVTLPQLTAVLSRTYIKFGKVKVGDSAKAKVTLSNIGNSSLTINNIDLEGTSKFAYAQSNKCGSKLAPGQSCKITIVFKPPLPIPYRHARVKVNDNVANQKIYLTGSGVK